MDQFKVFETATIIRNVRQICRQHGFAGDVFEANRYQGTLGQETTIIELLGQVPNELKRHNRTFITQLIRNCVLNSGVCDG